MATSNREWCLGVLACLLKNPTFLRKYGDVLKDWHFDYPFAKDYLKVIQTCLKSHGRMPSQPEFRHIVQTALVTREEEKSETTRQFFKDVKTLYKIEVGGVTQEALTNFITERSLESLAEKFPKIDHKGRAKFFDALMRDLRELQFLDASADDDDMVFLLDEKVIRETFRDQQNLSTIGYLTTGYPTLDELIGGFGPGEFSVFAGASGKGKTSQLCTVGIANVLAGKRVLHVSMDEPLHQMKMRYMTGLTGIPKKALVDEEQYLKAFNDLPERFKTNFILVSKPNETITTLDIMRMVERIKEKTYYSDLQLGIPPEEAGRVHLVITDYATKTKGWMSPKKRGDESWDKIRYSSEEHQHMARELNVPVVSAFQGNKEMAMSEFGQVTQLAMGYAGVQAVTNCLMVCQLQDDLHTTPARMWLYGAKTRDENGLFVVPYIYDKTRQRCWADTDRDVDYIDSTISKKAKPRTYSAEKQRAKDNRKGNLSKPNVNDAYEGEIEGETPSGQKWRGRHSDGNKGRKGKKTIAAPDSNISDCF